LDLEIKDIHPNRDRVLRPEFLCTYEFALKADTQRELPKYAQGNHVRKVDELDQKDLGNLNEAARFLRQNTTAQFVDYLDNLVIVPIDSESL